MNEISAKFKRQIEILGIAIKNTESLGTDDLAQMYGVERLTIKRDLQELRKHGIDIHSDGRKGVRLSATIGASRIQTLVSAYLALGNVGSSIDRASTLLVKKLGHDALAIVVTLQTCIDSHTFVTIAYDSERHQNAIQFTIGPIQIFQAGSLWRLLAMHDGLLKQFLLTKIAKADPSQAAFRCPSEADVQKVIQHSWESWIGTGRHSVCLRLSADWNRRLSSRQLIIADRVTKEPGGYTVVQVTVNSLEEFARWVVGLGKGVTIEDPPELKKLVLTLARGTLSNY